MSVRSFFNRQNREQGIVIPDEPQWKGNDINKEKLTLNDAKFLFEQAEKFLKDSVENSNLIVSRTSSLITLLAGTLVALIGYVISKLNLNNHYPFWNNINPLVVAAVTGIIYVYIGIYDAFENTKPQVYLIPGALPKDLFADAFFVAGIEADKRIIHFYVSETENYQFKIEKNNELNKVRWNRYERLLKAIVFLPLILCVVYLTVWGLLIMRS